MGEAVNTEKTFKSEVIQDRRLENNHLSKNNKLRPEDRVAHDWYRFVLSFPPHLVRKYIDHFNLNKNSLVLDPFCGTGTTLVECKKKGIPSIGIEAHPMACFASKIKTNWEIEESGLMNHALRIGERTIKKLKRGIGNENPKLLKSLPVESYKLLLKNSISPIPLHKVLTLLETINENEHSIYTDYERLALAKALVSDIGNLRFGPEVGIGRIKEDVLVLKPWLNNIDKMVKHLTELKGKPDTESSVIRGDSRTIDSYLQEKSIDAVITSPPYPNEKDYSRTTRLETVILGYITDLGDLRALKQTLLRSNTRGVYKTDTDDRFISDNHEVIRISEEIEEKRVLLGKTSGFERMYPRVTKLYFGGIYSHLSRMRNVLIPNARLAYVVGDQASYLRVMIRTGEITSRIAETLGYEIEDIELFRTRLATATKQQLREEVVLLKWPGK